MHFLPLTEKKEAALPATEFGLGIMSDEDACDGYGTGPSGEWTGGCGAPAEALVCCCWSILDGGSAAEAVAPLESSSATGEQVSARTLCARPCWPLPLRLPSLLHSRLEPLRSSFSEELVMVAECRGGHSRPEKGDQNSDADLTATVHTCEWTGFCSQLTKLQP